MAAMLASCDSASHDLVAIKTARSLTDEWAFVAELEAKSALRSAYAEGMRREARQQLASAHKQISGKPGAPAEAIATAATLPEKADAAVLRSAAARLTGIEKQREDH
jgi:hypothetical protein